MSTMKEISLLIGRRRRLFLAIRPNSSLVIRGDA
jgi:hypothetical protein